MKKCDTEHETTMNATVVEESASSTSAVPPAERQPIDASTAFSEVVNGTGAVGASSASDVLPPAENQSIHAANTSSLKVLANTGDAMPSATAASIDELTRGLEQVLL